MEIERKFTIRQLPENLQEYPCRLIEQGYLSTEPVVRVRRDGDEYYMTYKGGGMMAREEYNLPLTADAYEHLIRKSDGIVIRKRRYVIPIPDERNLKIELDLFEGVYDGLIIAEVEFPDLETAQAYQPEDWFLEDVTNDPRYHNSFLSSEDRTALFK
ncbi:MAG: CYTH domain-containing protein [Lachnospiraceae bacterium]|nr:CYTH domain-containing protein [Lachnospiraceae bacterium]MBR2996741.1 CYTH domain-containing protein [Lachnospiraceae bacterium]